MPLNNEEQGDKKESDDGEGRVLVIGHNMCTSTIGLEPKKTWDPMKEEPQEHRGGRFYLGKGK